MNTRQLTLIIVFAALSVALAITGPEIPAPYAPILFYRIWEIPIVAAFFVGSPKVSVAIAALNTLMLFVVFNPYANAAPLYSLYANLSMLLGIYLVYKFATRDCNTRQTEKTIFLRQKIKMFIITATVGGIATRVLITTVVNYFALQLPPPLGYSFTQQSALLFLPLSALFNATTASYTIPIGILLAAAATLHYKQM